MVLGYDYCLSAFGVIVLPCNVCVTYRGSRHCASSCSVSLSPVAEAGSEKFIWCRDALVINNNPFTDIQDAFRPRRGKYATLDWPYYTHSLTLRASQPHPQQGTQEGEEGTGRGRTCLYVGTPIALRILCTNKS